MRAEALDDADPLRALDTHQARTGAQPDHVGEFDVRAPPQPLQMVEDIEVHLIQVA
jgi:hypothetical protein